MLTLFTFVALFIPLGDVTFPDTPAGRTAAAFIRNYNTGRAEAMRTFEAEFRAVGGTQSRTIDERIAIFEDLRRKFGDLTPIRIDSESESELALIAKTSTDGAMMQLRFMCDAEPPHKLRGIAIQPAEESGMNRLTPAQRQAALDELLKILTEQYVFPDKVEVMGQRLRSALADGAYDKLETPRALAERWTGDLQAVCGDKHLRVRVSDAQAGPRIGPRGDAAAENYGFERIELLPGNIGYIKLNGFGGHGAAEAPAAAAMAFVRRCDQLVFDLRENGGGSPSMIRFLQSYLFDERTHLNSFRNRAGELVDESWTRDDVPGEKLGSKIPVFVLTSHYTFSGAEEFAYNLQARGRATIVGETSGGGAHPVRPVPFGEHFVVTVPFMRAENPVTKSNWEGTGVVPDMQVPADKALDAALGLARRGSDDRSSPPPSPSDADRTAVERAVLDYCEAFYENKPEYLERSVERSLVKFGYFLGRDNAWTMHRMSFDQALALAGKYKRRAADSPKRVRILDVQEQIACASLTAEWGIDYVHLHKVGDRWVIAQVVWQSLRP